MKLFAPHYNLCAVSKDVPMNAELSGFCVHLSPSCTYFPIPTVAVPTSSLTLTTLEKAYIPIPQATKHISPLN